MRHEDFRYELELANNRNPRSHLLCTYWLILKEQGAKEKKRTRQERSEVARFVKKETLSAVRKCCGRKHEDTRSLTGDVVEMLSPRQMEASARLSFEAGVFSDPDLQHI